MLKVRDFPKLCNWKQNTLWACWSVGKIFNIRLKYLVAWTQNKIKYIKNLPWFEDHSFHYIMFLYLIWIPANLGSKCYQYAVDKKGKEDQWRSFKVIEYERGFLDKVFVISLKITAVGYSPCWTYYCSPGYFIRS